MTTGFDPYYTWLGIPPSEQPPDHYRLLGLRQFEDHEDAISNACDARMAFIRTFQAGRHSAESQKLLNKIAKARICLLNPDKKRAYDEQLKANLAATPSNPTTPVETAVATKPIITQGHNTLKKAQPPSDGASSATGQVLTRPRPSKTENATIWDRLRDDWRWQAGVGGLGALVVLVLVIAIRNLGSSSDDLSPVAQPEANAETDSDKKPDNRESPNGAVPSPTTDSYPQPDDVPNVSEPKTVDSEPEENPADRVSGVVTSDAVSSAEPAEPVVATPRKTAVKPTVPQTEAEALEALEQLAARITTTGRGGLIVRIKSKVITNEELAMLKLLKIVNLTLDDVGLTDTGLEHIGAIETLTYLHLYNAKNVTDAGFRHLAGLQNLETLVIREIPISSENFGHIGQLSKLRNLHVPSEVVDDEALAHLQRLPIHGLFLEESKISEVGFSLLKNFPELRAITFPRSASVENLKYVKEVPALQSLTLYDNHVLNGGLEQIRDLKGLVRLTVVGSRNLDEPLSSVRGVNASQIALHGDIITDKGLAHFKNSMTLQEISIYHGPGVTDAGLVHLRDLTNLVSLRLTGTSVSDAGIASLRMHLPDCRISE